MLICLEDWGEEIAKSPDALEDDLRSQASGVDGADIQFFPGERRGDCGVMCAGTQGVGGRCIAAGTILGIANRDATFPMRQTVSEGNQIRIGSSELLSHRFDSAADALEGIPSC